MTQTNPVKHWTVKGSVRVELPKRTPCFHCSKSLQYLPPKKAYVGFSLDGKVFHSACVGYYLEGRCPDCYCVECQCEGVDQ